MILKPVIRPLLRPVVMTPALAILLGVGAFNPRHLFADPSAVGVHLETYDPNSILQRVNRLTYSSQFGNAAWTRTNILSVTEQADGVGDLVVPNTTAGVHCLTQNVSSTGAMNAKTVRAKAGGYSFVAIRIGSLAAWFNLSAGAKGTVQAGLTATIDPVVGMAGYYDCTVSGAASGANADIFVASADGGFSFAGDGTSGVYLARAQLEWNTTTPSTYQEVTDWNTEFLAAGGDRVTMWQDVARTQPVWAVEQSIASFRDTSRAGSTVYVSQPTSGFQAKLKARVNQLVATETLATQSVTTLATGYVLRFTGTGTVTLSGTATSAALSAGTHNITCTAGSLTLTVAGTVTQADLRTSADAALNIPAYQRVNTSTDYDTDGFPHRAVHDGSDDYYSFALNLSTCNKLDVFIDGLLKQSDAAAAVLIEHTANSGTTAGGLAVFAPNLAAAASMSVRSGGTVVSNAATATTFAAPLNASAALSADIAGDALTMDVNGTQAATSTSDQGTGNYANDTCYFGARAGTTLRSSMGWTAITIVGSPTANVSAAKKAQRVRWGQRRAKII